MHLQGSLLQEYVGPDDYIAVAILPIALLCLLTLVGFAGTLVVYDPNTTQIEHVSGMDPMRGSRVLMLTCSRLVYLRSASMSFRDS